MNPHPASLKLSLWDAFFFSLMIGAGETYLPAYALASGMSEWLTGIFATAPLMSGAILQLASPWLLARVGSIQKWVVGSAFVQAISFLPFLYFSIHPTLNFFWLFLAASIYWAAGFAAGPSWNFWMGQLIPEDAAAHFFSKRHRISQIGILLGLVGGGLALHWKIQMGPFISVFSFLFFLSFLSRSLSSLFLFFKQNSPPVPDVAHSFRQILALRKLRTHRSFFGFLFFFYISIYISSPFVTPFFLEKLKLDYDQYMVALAALFLAKIAVLPLAGPLMKNFGVKRVFFWGAMGIAPLPALWALNHQMWFVMSVQAVSGAFWGLFEVSLSVTFFNQIKDSQKIILLTAYNFFNATAMILGSLIGGEILQHSVGSASSYFFIFVFGASMRCLLVIAYALRTRRRVHLLGTSEDIEHQNETYGGPLSKHLKIS